MPEINTNSKQNTLAPEEIKLLCEAEITAQTRRIDMLVDEIHEASQRIIAAKRRLTRLAMDTEAV